MVAQVARGVETTYQFDERHDAPVQQPTKLLAININAKADPAI
jgi:hypothetical protein